MGAPIRRPGFVIALEHRETQIRDQRTTVRWLLRMEFGVGATCVAAKVWWPEGLHCPTATGGKSREHATATSRLRRSLSAIWRDEPKGLRPSPMMNVLATPLDLVARWFPDGPVWRQFVIYRYLLRNATNKLKIVAALREWVARMAPINGCRRFRGDGFEASRHGEQKQIVGYKRQRGSALPTELHATRAT